MSKFQSFHSYSDKTFVLSTQTFSFSPIPSKLISSIVQ